MRTTNGGWSQGTLGDSLYFNWATNANINSNTNSITHMLRLDSSGDAHFNRYVYAPRFYTTSSIRYKNVFEVSSVEDSINRAIEKLNNIKK
jgi:hypothetical protein